MQQRAIVIAPDPGLKRRAAPVGRVDAGIRRLMDEMLDAMYGATGIGLAAPQVGVLKRVIVVDVSPADQPAHPYRMADPVITWASEELATGEEGCLSLPEHYADVTRPARIRVRYRDETDAERELETDGLLAKCIQHEIDHLDGILFVDHLSTVKRGIILRKLAKAKKLASVAA